MNTGDDWQKSQWLPPRLAQGTRVIRQVSCSRRRVGKVGEARSRLTVEQNVFSRALGATPYRAEMLHTFPSMKNSGGRRRRSAHPDRTGCLHPPRKRRLKLRPSIDGHRTHHTCNHSRMASGKTKSLLNVRFGKRLGALRKEKGWTFVYLAEHSGLDDAFLHNLEHGTKEPCLNTIDILAKSFELSISELMRGV